MARIEYCKIVDSARKIYNHKYYTKISNNYNC